MDYGISKSTTVEQLAALICQHLKKKGLHAILTGGSAVSIYTQNEYQSVDLDFICRAGRRNLQYT